jgi:radical SAM superfamily enzyme YgiQ (UPF0313 family)
MNILLISTNRDPLPMPVMPGGACMVAEAAKRAGHTVRFLDLMFSADALNDIQSAVTRLKPDVIGLSVRNIDNNDMMGPVLLLQELPAMVSAIRKKTVAPIVLGGAALGVMPEEILRLGDCSCCVIGSGEEVFPVLLERIGRNEPFDDLPGIAFIENGAFRRNAAVPSACADCWTTPDYHQWLDLKSYRSRMASVPFRTKIGCPFHCVYCTYSNIEGSLCRFAEPGHVADAVTRLSAGGLQDIEFVDSVFNEPYDHAMAVCEALARAGHRARLQSLELNPRSFDDALVTAMERAGFAGMGITVESASDPVLNGLRKGFTSREVHRASEVVARHGIPCMWIFMLGGPGETEETVKETLKFAEINIRPRDIAFFNIGIRIYPGTELESIARNQGLLLRAPEEMLAPVFYVSPGVERHWMEQEVKKFMNTHLNVINNDSIGHSLLPAIHRIGHYLGLKPPLWRHTSFIRRGLRAVGMDV